MPKILVKKSNPLKGSVKIDGAKNAVLPIIAATLLAKGKSTLNGVPNLKDVHVISDLLRHLGAEVEYNNNTLTDRKSTRLNSSHPSSSRMPSSA